MTPELSDALVTLAHVATVMMASAVALILFAVAVFVAVLRS